MADKHSSPRSPLTSSRVAKQPRLFSSDSSTATTSFVDFPLSSQLEIPIPVRVAEEDVDEQADNIEDSAEEMTPSLAAGTVSLQQRLLVIQQQIDELSIAGQQIIDQMKKEFIARLERTKYEISQFCDTQVSVWRQTNAESQEVMQRLANAKHLVRSLGIQATTVNEELAINITDPSLQSDDAVATGLTKDG